MQFESDKLVLGQVLLRTGKGVAARARGCVLGLAQLDSAPMRNRVELAVSEVVQNIWRHAYQGKVGAPLKIAVYQSADGIEIVFSDQGAKLSEAPVGRADPTELQAHGRGVGLIKQLAQGYHYMPGAAGEPTLQRLMFSFSAEESAI